MIFMFVVGSGGEKTVGFEPVRFVIELTVWQLPPMLLITMLWVFGGSRLHFIDSSGRGGLVILAKNAREKQQRFVLAAFPGYIREVLVRTRLDRLLMIFAGTVQEYACPREV
jgi:hypothetical protein